MKLVLPTFAAALATMAALPSLASAQHTVPLLGGARQIHIQTSGEPATFTGSAFRRVAKIDDIVVPTGWKGVLVATFNAESTCSEDLCVVKILCDGEPIPNADPFHFNTAEITGEPTRRTHSVTRRSRVVGGGVHTCEVRSAQRNGEGSHVLDDWLFAVEFWRAD